MILQNEVWKLYFEYHYHSARVQWVNFDIWRLKATIGCWIVLKVDSQLDCLFKSVLVNTQELNKYLLITGECLFHSLYRLTKNRKLIFIADSLWGESTDCLKSGQYSVKNFISSQCHHEKKRIYRCNSVLISTSCKPLVVFNQKIWPNSLYTKHS